MLPAAASRDGVTIVIVPMVALRQDMCERSNEKGIPCAEWDGKRPPYHARIILATPESAVTPAFGRFIEEKKRSHQLERIVIDECHMILESTDQWRPKVRQLKEMAGKGVQVLYLTATLPPSEEAAFHEAIGVPEREMFTLRDRTVRPNTAYAVIGYEKKEEDEEVRQLVEEKLDQYPEPGQVIVYCRKVEQAKRLAVVLGCSVYHRTVGDQKKKKGILHRLTGQTERVFTATNALGVGIDAPTIRAVIHVGIPKELKQYSQESGRAGRDGQASEAIIMQANTTDRNGRRRREVGYDTEDVMKEFVAGERCRRAVLDGYIDGQFDRRDCEEEEQRCDVCRGITAVEGRRRVRVVARVEEDVSPDTQPPEAHSIIPEAYTPDGEEDRAVVNIGVRRRRSDVEMVESEDANKRRRTEESEGMEKARRTHERQEHRRRDSAIEKAEAGEKMEGQYRFWQERCEICHINGRASVGHHSWRDCPDGEEREAVRQVWEALGEIEFEAYTGCFDCWAPQGICQAWETVENGRCSRYRRARGGQCQFPGVLRDTVAAVVGVGRAELIEDFVQTTAAKERVKLDGSQESAVGQWMPWLRRKAKIGEVETSGLGRIFWELG
jgi:superfamily II DNA/RNA helicase